MAEQNPASGRQSADHLGISLGNTVREWFGTPSSDDPCGVQDVLGSVRDAVQGTEPGPLGEQPIRSFGLCQCERLGHGRKAEQGGIIPTNPVQIDARQPG